MLTRTTGKQILGIVASRTGIGHRFYKLYIRDFPFENWRIVHNYLICLKKYQNSHIEPISMNPRSFLGRLAARKQQLVQFSSWNPQDIENTKDIIIQSILNLDSNLFQISGLSGGAPGQKRGRTAKKGDAKEDEEKDEDIQRNMRTNKKSSTKLIQALNHSYLASGQLASGVRSCAYAFRHWLCQGL